MNNVKIIGENNYYGVITTAHFAPIVIQISKDLLHLKCIYIHKYNSFMLFLERGPWTLYKCGHENGNPCSFTKNILYYQLCGQRIRIFKDATFSFPLFFLVAFFINDFSKYTYMNADPYIFY